MSPVRQLRNGFSNFAQNLVSETIIKPFSLDGWLKVSYLLDHNYYLCYTPNQSKVMLVRRRYLTNTNLPHRENKIKS